MLLCNAMQTWGNRADAFVRQAELMAESSTAGEAGQQASRHAYAQSMEAYGTACSLTSSEQGDDLPGLLHNWGVGLASMAEHTQVTLLLACTLPLLLARKKRKTENGIMHGRFQLRLSFSGCAGMFLTIACIVFNLAPVCMLSGLHGSVLCLHNAMQDS